MMTPLHTLHFHIWRYNVRLHTMHPYYFTYMVAYSRAITSLPLTFNKQGFYFKGLWTAVPFFCFQFCSGLFDLNRKKKSVYLLSFVDVIFLPGRSRIDHLCSMSTLSLGCSAPRRCSSVTTSSGSNASSSSESSHVADCLHPPEFFRLIFYLNFYSAINILCQNEWQTESAKPLLNSPDILTVDNIYCLEVLKFSHSWHKGLLPAGPVPERRNKLYQV